MGRLGTLLVGGAIGAVAAMLMAPRTGPETQAQWRERVKGLKDQYGPSLEQGRIRATELIQSGKDMLETGKTSIASSVNRNQETETGQNETQEGRSTPHQQL